MNSEITINNIGKARVAGLIGLGLLLVVALTTQAFSQTILIDDFNDGNADGWTTFDWTVDQPWGPGTFDVGSGALHLEGAGLVPDSGGGYPSVLGARWEPASDPVFTDGFLRAKIMVHELGGAAGIWLRGGGHINEPGSGHSYGFFGYTTWNGIPGNGRFFFGRYNENASAFETPLPDNLSFGVEEEWYIEAGAVGDQLSVKVWRVGDTEPESPQWTRTDTTHRTGGFGVAAFVGGSWTQPARTSATIDDIQFRFPEHNDVFSVSPYNNYLWDYPMPVPQQEGPYFVADSPEKPDMRGDVTTAEGWPDLHLTGKVTDFDGKPIPGLKLDFWQTDDQGNYDNSGGYDLRGHVYTDAEGNYELWTVIPAAYETVRTRHLHLKIGGLNLGFQSPVFTTQLYFPTPYDNDIDADGTPDKVVQGGFETDFDAIGLEDDYITLGDLMTIGAEFSDLTGNILTVNNDPAIDGYFDGTLNIRMSDVFQAPEKTPNRILIDNFNDGNDDDWERIDGTTGKNWSPGIFDVSSGEYRLGSTGLITRGDLFDPVDDTYVTVPWEKSTDPLYSNGLYRWKFKITENASSARFIMRGGEGNFYGFGAASFDIGFPNPRGPNPGGAFFFDRFEGHVNTYDLVFHDEVEPHLGDEWMLEAGVVGDRLSMKWWPVDEPEPTEPQWEWTDPDPLPEGRIALNVFISQMGVNRTGTPGPWRLGATFDDIYFTFPEYDNVYGISPYNAYLWESPMPVPQVEEPNFVAGSPNKTDMRGDVTKTEGWPDLHLTGKVTDLDGKPIPGLRLDFWQVDDKGSYDNTGGYALRGHLFTDNEGNYELWTIMPAAYDSYRTRNLHVKLGGLNLGFYSPVFTTQLYFPNPYDNDIDADGTPDKVIQDGVETDLDAIGLEEDSIALVGLVAVDAEPSDLASNKMTLNNELADDGYFDATLNIVMPKAFKTPND
jgi:protocatechuate 3,4-dioxygenase beta subunit